MDDVRQQLDEKEIVLNLIYNNYDTNGSLGLTLEQLQHIYGSLRESTLSLAQIEAAAHYVCACPVLCDREELLDVLKEMDRRYYLSRDLRWEFAMLDHQRKSCITQKDAMFLFQMVHGEFFSKYKFDLFMQNRLAPNADITYEEIEVDLCNIPTHDWMEELFIEKQREEKELEMRQKEILRKQKEMEEAKQQELDIAQQMEEMKRRNEILAEKKRNEENEKMKSLEAERLAKEQEEADFLARQQQQEAARQKQLELDESERAKLEEERLERARIKFEKDEQERLAERERLRKLEEKRKEDEEKARLEAEAVEETAESAAQAETVAQKEAADAETRLKAAQDEEERKQCDEDRKKALEEMLKHKETRLRCSLKAAVKVRKRPKIDAVVFEAKEAEMTALKPDIEIAEEASECIKCGEQLEDAMVTRDLAKIELSVEAIKSKGYEKDYVEELMTADKLTEKLRRLERAKKEILALDQRTIAEIRSYKVPVPAIHEVMIAVYVILGYKEKELQTWKYIQALLGRSGKEGLKRMATTLDATKVGLALANHADKKYLSKHDLVSITDFSAGAATFFVWSTAMIEETRSWNEDIEFRKRVEQKRKEEAEEAKKLEEERKKKTGGGGGAKTAKDATRSRVANKQKPTTVRKSNEGLTKTVGRKTPATSPGRKAKK